MKEGAKRIQFLEEHVTRWGAKAYFASENGEDWYSVPPDAPYIDSINQWPWTKEAWQRL